MQKAAKKPATVRIARWSATHPWSAMGLWAVFVALCIFLGGAGRRRRRGADEVAAEVASVGSVMPAENGKAVLVPVAMKGHKDDAAENVEPLLDVGAAVPRCPRSWASWAVGRTGRGCRSCGG
ncbi:hypothetical protein ACH41E_30060 [Streptomyces sp. NPDC020412]|uniref:hypothetical protein n=1 Tax=Streptomyces sp. NPDC020412 TaxID=3365073 RepID=UPI0037AAAA19